MSASLVDRPALARTAPGIERRSPRQHGVAVLVDLVGVEVEEPEEVRVGAEATVAHTDRLLGAEASGDEGVVHAVDDEGGHRQALDVEGRRGRARRRWR